MKLITSVLFLLTVLTPLGLYFMKNEVRQMEQEIVARNKALTSDQEEIRVLQAEWSYLNQPARLDELSLRYLGLGPVVTNQIIMIDDLPYRKLKLVDYPITEEADASPIRPVSVGLR